MEVEVSGSSFGDKAMEDGLKVKRKTILAVLEQCQRALYLLSNNGGADVNDDDDDDDEDGDGRLDPNCSGCSTLQGDREADELCDLLKSRVECPDFLEKLGGTHPPIPQCMSVEEGSTWDVVSKSEVWEDGSIDIDQDDYILVSQEDIVDGIACFMAAYLFSLKQTKELTPNQIQKTLSKTFSLKTKKGKLRKAWDGSKVIYNVASWGSTAIGIYQNPALLKAASDTFWASCDVLSKLL